MSRSKGACSTATFRPRPIFLDRGGSARALSISAGSRAPLSPASARCLAEYVRRASGKSENSASRRGTKRFEVAFKSANTDGENAELFEKFPIRTKKLRKPTAWAGGRTYKAAVGPLPLSNGPHFSMSFSPSLCSQSRTEIYCSYCYAVSPCSH